MRVGGAHREVGIQIGAATAAAVRRHADAVDPLRRAQAVAYRDATAADLPWLVEEIDGVAEGAGADPLAVFAASVEEIWADAAVPAGRCSDMVGCAPATADGHVWVAHNNDLEPEREDELVALEWHVDGEPVSLTIGVGPWISVGFNSAGLALTGNELSPSDDRVGIPRLLLVRDILRRRTLDEAVAAALHPAPGVVVQQPPEPPRRRGGERRGLGHRCRAAAARGRARSPTPTTTRARGWPATSAIPPRPRARGRGSGRRAGWLARGPVTPQLLRDALSDHTGAPDSLCRHTEHGAESKTVFWCIADVTEGTVRYGRGNPCDSHEQQHAFA